MADSRARQTANRLRRQPSGSLATDLSGSAAPEYALCGHVSGMHGTRGWIKVHSHTHPIENLLRYRPWQLRGGGAHRVHDLESGRRVHRGLIAKLRDVDDRDEAAALRGLEIWIDPARFPLLPRGEYYHRDLLGLAAHDQRGRTLGVVERVLETAVHDVLLVRGDQERLIPYAPGETVLRVDLERRRIDVRWDGVRE